LRPLGWPGVTFAKCTDLIPHGAESTQRVSPDTCTNFWGNWPCGCGAEPLGWGAAGSDRLGHGTSLCSHPPARARRFRAATHSSPPPRHDRKTVCCPPSPLPPQKVALGLDGGIQPKSRCFISYRSLTRYLPSTVIIPHRAR
jgi:hypothetical protein